MLWKLVYEAIHVPPGQEAPPRSIVRTPPVAQYVEGWGRSGDIGVAAIERRRFLKTRVVGAAWVRILSPPHTSNPDGGYGFVGPDIPELSIAVLPRYRGKGIGTRLLRACLLAASEQYNAVSLSVSRTNQAVRLYRREGFAEVQENRSSCTMLYRFAPPSMR